MKSTKEIIGLRIISVADGTQVGLVKDLVLNPQGGTLEFFICDQPIDYFGAKVIAFHDILGLGEFALTIPDINVIQDVAQNAAIQELLKQDVRVIGTKVLTKKGQLIGQVQEILINEENGTIASCVYEASSEEVLEIDSHNVITFGKELLIVDDNGQNSPQMNMSEKVEELKASDLSPSQNSEMNDDVSEEETLVTPEHNDMEQVSESQEFGFNLFEQRQIQYFIGKTVEKDITLDDGTVLKAGEEMTDETVQRIKTRPTLMEITSQLHKN